MVSCTRSRRLLASAVDQVELAARTRLGAVLMSAWPGAPGPVAGRAAPSIRSRSMPVPGPVSCLCRRGPAKPHRAAGRAFDLVVIEASAVGLVTIAANAGLLQCLYGRGLAVPH